MRPIPRILTTVALLSLPMCYALGEVEIRSPGYPPSRVADDGSLVEPWGVVRLHIIEPADAEIAEHRSDAAPMPVAVTRAKAGPVTLTQSAYRSPIWPSGADVIEARIASEADEPTTVRLELAVPDEMQVGETMGTIQGQPSLVFHSGLNTVREEREWGCTGGVSALPGWAKPKEPCDAAFRNIAAGMGGVPITYRFAVPPGSKRTIMLGFCESHHPDAGLRPLFVQVEGAEDRSIDPIAKWGRHVPGVERFDAADADGDGRLQVTVAPHPQASDRNPILNVLWMFDTKTNIDAKKLIAGELNDRAERYVDVGGENDQLLYKPGNVRFVVELGPKEGREILVLARSPGGRQVPDLSAGLWNQETLRKAAADVWRDRWEETVGGKRE